MIWLRIWRCGQKSKVFIAYISIYLQFKSWNVSRTNYCYPFDPSSSKFGSQELNPKIFWANIMRMLQVISKIIKNTIGMTVFCSRKNQNRGRKKCARVVEQGFRKSPRMSLKSRWIFFHVYFPRNIFKFQHFSESRSFICNSKPERHAKVVDPLLNIPHFTLHCAKNLSFAFGYRKTHCQENRITLFELLKLEFS